MKSCSRIFSNSFHFHLEYRYGTRMKSTVLTSQLATKSGYEVYGIELKLGNSTRLPKQLQYNTYQIFKITDHNKKKYNIKSYCKSLG